MPTIFPTCQSGDQIRIKFEHVEELKAFNQVCERIKFWYDKLAPAVAFDVAQCEKNYHAYLENYDAKYTEEPGLVSIRVGRLFDTTLQYQVARENLAALRTIYDKLHVINIGQDRSANLTIYTK